MKNNKRKEDYHIYWSNIIYNSIIENCPKIAFLNDNKQKNIIKKEISKFNVPNHFYKEHIVENILSDIKLSKINFVSCLD